MTPVTAYTSTDNDTSTLFIIDKMDRLDELYSQAQAQLTV